MAEPSKAVTTTQLQKWKKDGRKIVSVTCYDYTFARWMDEHVDLVLVGDSLGMVVQGHPTTLPVTLDDMIYHSRAVNRGLRRAHLVVDMPFMTYQAGEAQALENAGRLMKEGHAHSVKVEGGVAIAQTVARMVESGIPVLGHVGLTPQSVHAFGGYKVQGREDVARERILTDALALEDSGAYGIVLEGIPGDLAATLTERLTIPTIGIGAGPQCDGQILVLQDMLGLNRDFSPKFVKPFAAFGDEVGAALAKYRQEIEEGVFPGPEHTFK